MAVVAEFLESGIDMYSNAVHNKQREHGPTQCPFNCETCGEFRECNEIVGIICWWQFQKPLIEYENSTGQLPDLVNSTELIFWTSQFPQRKASFSQIKHGRPVHENNRSRFFPRYCCHLLTWIFVCASQLVIFIPLSPAFGHFSPATVVNSVVSYFVVFSPTDINLFPSTCICVHLVDVD